LVGGVADVGPITSLWIYVTLVLVTTIIAWVRSKSLIFKMVWTLYALVAVSCLLCVIFQTQLLGHGGLLDYWYDLSDTTLWGYLLLYACTYIALLPLANVGVGDALKDFGSQQRALNAGVVFAIIYLVLVFIFVALSPDTVRSAFSTADYGNLRSQLYSDASNESTLVLTSNPIASLCFRMCNIFKLVSVAVAFMFYKEDCHKTLATVLLLSSFGLYYIYANANAARGGFLIYFFCSLLIASLFFRYLKPVLRRRLLIVLVMGAAVVAAFFMAVTISRFADDGGGGNPILRNIMFYLGHGPIEFSRITGSLTSHSNGGLVFGRLFSHWFGTSYIAADILLKIGYPQFGPLFVTYLWPVYCDFGYLGCLLIYSGWALFMRWVLRSEKLNRMSTVFIFSYYITYFVTGAFTIGVLEIASVVTYHVLWLCLRLLENIASHRSPRRVLRSRRMYRRV
jgi:oligosaccharide repeat unit polymerase